jgi:drug/metabolite transporter (DMT)-like permease
LIGFLILQFANIAFAIGQWNYQRWADQGSNAGNMAWMYLGAAAFASLVTFPQLDMSEIVVSNEQIGVLLYLGIIASGLCFYLWNSGSKQVTPATLAVMNNGYIPVAVVASIVLFSEDADLLRLVIGGGLILLSVVISFRTSYSTS